MLTESGVLVGGGDQEMTRIQIKTLSLKHKKNLTIDQ